MNISFLSNRCKKRIIAASEGNQELCNHITAEVIERHAAYWELTAALVCAQGRILKSVDAPKLGEILKKSNIALIKSRIQNVQ